MESTSWHWVAISDAITQAPLWILLGAGAAALLLGRAAFRLRPRTGESGERGTATVEFALVFPILLFLILIMLQTTLVMVGNMFVHYSAFSAVRSAIVHIPDRYTNNDGLAIENHNIVLTSADASDKQQTIQRAAAAALIPVSGEIRSTSVQADALAAAMGTHFSDLGRSEPNWVANKLAERFSYALEKTEIQLLTLSQVDALFEPIPTDYETYTFDRQAPICVEVRHKLNLSVPYVRVFFADGRHETLGGAGAYSLVTARSTLTNEGVETSMPPAPDRKRRDP